MVHLLPVDDDVPPAPDFVPAAPRPRRDGWTPEIQVAFIAALAGGESVAAACRRVGRSTKTAYALRQRDDATGFAAAWDTAQADAAVEIGAYALTRVRSPAVRPIFYRGRRVGERVVHDDRLLMTMLTRPLPRPPGTDRVYELLADPEAAGLVAPARPRRDTGRR